MSILDFAYWSPISYGFNSGLMQTPVRGLVVHITDGHGGLQIVHDDFDRPEKRASAHFGIDKQGSIWQFIDTSDRAWPLTEKPTIRIGSASKMSRRSASI